VLDVGSVEEYGFAALRRSAGRTRRAPPPPPERRPSRSLPRCWIEWIKTPDRAPAAASCL